MIIFVYKKKLLATYIATNIISLKQAVRSGGSVQRAHGHGAHPQHGRAAVERHGDEALVGKHPRHEGGRRGGNEEGVEADR